jgi:hypothetical protein
MAYLCCLLTVTGTFTMSGGWAIPGVRLSSNVPSSSTSAAGATLAGPKDSSCTGGWLLPTLAPQLPVPGATADPQTDDVAAALDGHIIGETPVDSAARLVGSMAGTMDAQISVAHNPQVSAATMRGRIYYPEYPPGTWEADIQESIKCIHLSDKVLMRQLNHASLYTGLFTEALVSFKVISL